VDSNTADSHLPKSKQGRGGLHPPPPQQTAGAARPSERRSKGQLKVKGFLRLSVSRLAATLGSYPAVDCVPVEDALAPAVLPLLHQADDVPLLNKTMTNLQNRTPEDISLYSMSTSTLYSMCWAP
jgi:hypothetical protein